MPAVTATAAKDGIMTNVAGVSRLAPAARAGMPSERMPLDMTRPRKRANPVQVPPVITWMKISRNLLFNARAATRTTGGITPMAKLQRSSAHVYGGSVEGGAVRAEASIHVGA